MYHILQHNMKTILITLFIGNLHSCSCNSKLHPKCMCIKLWVSEWVSEWVSQTHYFSVILWWELVNAQWDDDEVRFVLDQNECKLTEAIVQERHIEQLGHIILIPSQPVFAFSPWCCVFSGEATNTKMYSLWFDPICARTHDVPHSRYGEHANNYTTDAVFCKRTYEKSKYVSFEYLISICAMLPLEIHLI
jgi:hypothetical protein